MSPRRSVSQQRIPEIIDAAAAVFAAKGLDGATMDDIAAVAGINKATIYLYFESKDALVFALAEQLLQSELAHLRRAGALSSSATDRLRAFYEALIAEENDFQPLMPVLYEFYTLGLRRQDVRSVLGRFIEETTDLLEAIIAEGIAVGEFAATDARQAARSFSGLFDGILLQSAYREEMAVDAQLRFSIELLFRGLTQQS